MGSFSVLVHVVYVLALELIARVPPLIPLPLANPYLLFSAAHGLSPLDAAWALFAGLALLSLAAFVVGRLIGWAAFEFGEKSRFYGPLSDVIQSAAGDDKFITAYVLTKLTEGTRVLG